jgi:hypothetical protein
MYTSYVCVCVCVHGPINRTKIRSNGVMHRKYMNIRELDNFLFNNTGLCTRRVKNKKLQTVVIYLCKFVVQI